eukprot:6410639-Alexandrium_andersonii.AAC.1
MSASLVGSEMCIRDSLFVTQVRKLADLTAEGAALELNARKSGHVSVEQVQRETGYGPPKPRPRDNESKGSPEAK